MTLVVAGYPGQVQKVEFAKMMRFAWYHHVEGLSLQPSGAARGVEVTFARAIAPGILVEQTLPMVVNADANLSGDPRRDRIILKHDWGLNTTTLEVKEGTPGTNPQLPAVTLDPGVLFEQTLADLFTANGQGAYNPADIANRANPTASPVVVVPFSQFTPEAAERQIRIDPVTGLLRYSDGLDTDRPLRARLQDLDRAVLNLNGNGLDNPLTTGNEEFRTTLSVAANVGGFTSDQNTAEWVLPLTGLYLLSMNGRCVTSPSGLTANEEFHLFCRRDGTPGTVSGTLIFAAAGDFHGFNEAYAAAADVIGPYVAGTRLKFTIQNTSGVTITELGSGHWKHISLVYLGPA